MPSTTIDRPVADPRFSQELPHERDAPASARRQPVRPEIQALRAVAVTLVVLYHAWPSLVPGGFIGVDVFFVISGFLISGMLAREVDRSGRVSLSRFWARRARRLLPAALLTILACAIATMVVVPVTSWPPFFSDMRASALYVENWHLANTSVDYFAADGPSPLQHFWSLAVEEQFYIAWPLLLVAGIAAAGRRAVVPVVATVTAASLAYGIWRTAADPALAYFSTPARAWEFGAGALLALAPPATGARDAARLRHGGRVGPGIAAARVRQAGRAALSWLGLAAIVVAALAYSDATPFPGVAALLPVLGAVAVIRAGLPRASWSPSKGLRVGPVQLIGDLSYSIYLWHWPLLVLVPLALDRPLGTGGLIGVVAATVVLAWGTKLLVEDPVRNSVVLGRRPPLTFALAVVATGVVLGVLAIGGAIVERRLADASRTTQQILDDRPRCFGAAALGCDNPELDKLVVPTPLEAARLPNAPCEIVERGRRLSVCAFGVAPQQARETVAVLGDSHASAWRAALEPVARERGWRGLSVTRTRCPYIAATPVLQEPTRTNCLEWNRDVRRWFADHPEIRTVIVAARAGINVEAGGRNQFVAARSGYERAWRELPASVERIVVLRDTPRMRFTTQGCVQDALGAGGLVAGEACGVASEFALAPDPQVAAADRLGSARAAVVDLSPRFCDAKICRPVIGGALVFKDEDHLTAVFAETLAPFLEEELRAVLPGR